MSYKNSTGETPLVDDTLPQSKGTRLGTELRGYLAPAVPDYMGPGVFVTLDPRPFAANEKIDLIALPALKASHIGSEVEVIAPMTPGGQFEEDLILGSAMSISFNLIRYGRACSNHLTAMTIPVEGKIGTNREMERLRRPNHEKKS